MRLISFVLQISTIFIFIGLITFSSKITEILIEPIFSNFSIIKNERNKNILYLIIYLIIGTLSFFIALSEYKYLEDNSQVSFIRKILLIVRNCP